MKSSGGGPAAAVEEPALSERSESNGTPLSAIILLDLSSLARVAGGGSALTRNLKLFRDTALRLAHFFGTSPEFWLNLQSLYEIRLAHQKSSKSIKTLPTLRRAHLARA
jgi:hypothetical protein